MASSQVSYPDYNLRELNFYELKILEIQQELKKIPKTDLTKPLIEKIDELYNKVQLDRKYLIKNGQREVPDSKFVLNSAERA